MDDFFCAVQRGEQGVVGFSNGLTTQQEEQEVDIPAWHCARSGVAFGQPTAGVSVAVLGLPQDPE
jgi:hypothetical protein